MNIKIDTTLERDIDLLILEEFISDPEFAKIFLSAVGINEEYSIEDARKHYTAHVGKDFYPALEKYITSDIAFGMIVEGENAIEKIRELIGSTKNPAEGTIRYDIPKMLGLELRVRENVVHASDSTEAAEQEIKIFEDNIKRKQ